MAVIILVAIVAALIAQVCVIVARPKVRVDDFGPGQEPLERKFHPKESLALVKAEAAQQATGAVRADAAATEAGVAGAVAGEIFDLRLELIGTAMGNVKDPIAFIKDLDSGKQGIYKLGHLIKEAKIVRIAKGEVDLQREGTTQTLRTSQRNSALARLEYESNDLVTREGNTITVHKQAMLKEKGKLLRSVKSVKVRPCYDNEQVIGLKVEGVSPDSVLAMAGFRDQDVLTQVNMQKIDSYQKALQVFRKAKNQKDIKVCLLRAGKLEQLQYSIE